MIAALGLVPVLQPFGTIAPITAQTLGVMLAGSVLGARRGALAVVTFLVLVAAGLPLLAGGRGGLPVFAGLSAGFLFGWILGAWVIGYLVERRPARMTFGWLVLANIVGGMGVVYAVGIPVMAIVGGLAVVKATTLSAVYIPGDLVKVVLTSVVTAGVLRGYPGVVATRSRLVTSGVKPGAET